MVNHSKASDLTTINLGISCAGGGEYLVGIHGIQVQQLRNDNIGHVVLHRTAAPDNPLRQTARKRSHAAHYALERRPNDSHTCWKSWLTTLWNRSITMGEGPRSPAASTGK
jgi:hypothetical protein